MTMDTSGICPQSNELTAALRGFGAATEALLLAWLDSLPPKHAHMLDVAVSAGCQVGVKVMCLAPGKAATLEMLATTPDGECHVLGTLVHEYGAVQ